MSNVTLLLLLYTGLFIDCLGGVRFENMYFGRNDEDMDCRCKFTDN